MADIARSFQLVPPERRIRFGPFEVDSKAGELRKHGIKVRIGQQSLQVLLMLLEHPGEVVLREDLRQNLWPHDTVVEFDHSINAAIQKLRGALGESAEKPRYIDTLPRRGYRFAGTVDAPQPVATGTPAPSVPPVHSVPDAIESPPRPAEGRRGPRNWPLALGAAVMVAVLALVLVRSWPPPAKTSKLVFSLGNIGPAVISPDGSALVYRTPRGLTLHRMNSIGEIPVYSLGRASDAPAWTADGAQVVFPSSDLLRLPLPNGPPAILTSLPYATRGLTSAPDGSVLMAMFSGKPESGDLYQVPAGGGKPARVAAPTLTDGMFFEPEFLPDGRNILFAWSPVGDGTVGLYLAALQGGKVTRGPFLLRRNVTAGHYSPSHGGQLLYVQDDKLYAQGLNVSRGTLDGPPEHILDGVASNPNNHFAQFSVSRNGVLVWRAGLEALAQLTWFDRAGTARGVAGPQCLPEVARLSADGTRVMLRILSDHGGYGVAEVNRSGFTPLTGLVARPLWMPHSSHILYIRKDGDSYTLVERSIEDGAERALRPMPPVGVLLDISPDGKVLLYHLGPRLYSLRLDEPGATPQFLARAVRAQFSPDGRWIVYTDASTAPTEVSVQPFPPRGLPMQLTVDGGADPVWRGDGEEILYLKGSTIYSLRVQARGNTLSAGSPKALFQVRVPQGMTADFVPMDVSRDGSRILFAQGVENADSMTTYVMTAWDSLLRR